MLNAMRVVQNNGYGYRLERETNVTGAATGHLKRIERSWRVLEDICICIWYLHLHLTLYPYPDLRIWPESCA